MPDPRPTSAAVDQTVADPEALGIPDLKVLQRLARAVQHLHHESLRANDRFAEAFGIAGNDFTAFLIIAGTPQATPKHLSRDLRLTTSAITALLDRLETADLISRTAHPSDRRSTVVLLTDRGIEMKAGVYRSYLAALAAGIERDPRLGAASTAALLHSASEAIAGAGAAGVDQD